MTEYIWLLNCFLASVVREEVIKKTNEKNETHKLSIEPKQLNYLAHLHVKEPSPKLMNGAISKKKNIGEKSFGFFAARCIKDVHSL